MKKIIGISFVLGVLFSGCATRYSYKCDAKTGICEETMTTNANVDMSIKMPGQTLQNVTYKKTQNNSINKTITKTSKIPQQKKNVVIKEAVPKTTNIQIIFEKDQPTQNQCDVDDSLIVPDYMDNTF